VIVWLSFDEADPENNPLAPDGDLRRLGAGLSVLGGLFGLAVAGLDRRAGRLRGGGADDE
jgi:hypothetical protein